MKALARRLIKPLSLALSASLLLAACLRPVPEPTAAPATEPSAAAEVPTPEPGTTPLPTRGVFEAGERLPYVIQTGDTVTALAAHFNTTPEEILAANPGLNPAATLPPGQAVEVPAYYFPLGGPAFQIIPDSEFVYGPGAMDLDLAAYLNAQPGYLSRQSAFVAGRTRTAADTVLYVAAQYSVNPKLLLALLEWRSGAITRSQASSDAIENPLGLSSGPRGFYLQMNWAAEQLSLGYYGWRSGARVFIPLSGSYRSRVDMYQNAGTVGVQYLLGQLLPREAFEDAAGPDGFARTYNALWGNPFDGPPVDVIPGHLVQPELALPFVSNQQWALTGGPHPGWGTNLPWSALDFAPPAGETGCISTGKWVTASAPGVIVRSHDNTLVVDLDGDGYEQTGWVLFYFHLADRDLAPAGKVVQTGDPLGHPSCEGGRSTGTHVHMARKYNGEWIPADGLVPGVLPFVIGGWQAVKGEVPYKGRMTRIGAWVEACTCSTAANRIYWVP